MMLICPECYARENDNDCACMVDMIEVDEHDTIPPPPSYRYEPEPINLRKIPKKYDDEEFDWL